MKVAVIDYGIGNTNKVVKFVSSLGFQVVVDQDGTALSEADSIVISGVSAFGSCMQRLDRNGQAVAIVEAFRLGKRIVGLCAGAQILTTQSEESPGVLGLALVPAATIRIPSEGIKVPNQGWMLVNPEEINSGWKSRLCEISGYYYFSHSYHVDPIVPGGLRALYSGSREQAVLSVYEYENIIGLQFHPELSGAKGAELMTAVLAN